MSFGQSSLKALVLRGSTWTIAGSGSGQLIRLIRNLILTRLLFPEAFGLMTLVWMVMYGLEMLSDVGLGPAIIRDPRGDDPDFLNTAWTVQAIRGAVLWGASCLIAYPMATFYSAPDLAQLIPVAGLTALLALVPAAAADPTAQPSTGELREITLVAEPVRWEIQPGLVVDGWGYNGSIPGPAIRVTEGDRVRVDPREGKYLERVL